MEMTPISQRDVSVLVGVGAEPQGRETSSSRDKEATTTQSTTPEKKPDYTKPEYPVDPKADALAQRLRMADPNMDGETARKIAKELLKAGPKWETEENATTTGDVAKSQFTASA